MTCHYIGKKNPLWGEKKVRGAELWARYDDDERYNDKRDCEILERTVKLLKIHGWKFTEGVPGWAFCHLESREEYDEFHEDYRACKRCITKCVDHGF